jgi:hypothetical protein
VNWATPGNGYRRTEPAVSWVTRGNGFRGAEPEVVGSGSGTQCLALLAVEPGASGCGRAEAP